MISSWYWWFQSSKFFFGLTLDLSPNFLCLQIRFIDLGSLTFCFLTFLYYFITFYLSFITLRVLLLDCLFLICLTLCINHAWWFLLWDVKSWERDQEACSVFVPVSTILAFWHFRKCSNDPALIFEFISLSLAIK